MAQFRVAQVGCQSFMLEDGAGKRHLARALQAMPTEGALLHGPRPVRGFAILCDATSRQLCRVMIEQVDCEDSAFSDRRSAA